ncbi:MAG: hypothetical protein LBJ90_02790 [Treponema sp.]|jgi:hypothetical protein|nr:hypothetical protein [Treponema sp.]
MNNNKRKKPFVRPSGAALKTLAALASAVLLSSCAAKITGGLGASGSGDFIVTAGLQPKVSALIRSFKALAGETDPRAPVIDGAAIAQSMSSAPGVASVSFRNSAPAAIEGPVRISRISDFLAPAEDGQARGFIRFEQAPEGGRCTITLSRESGPGILSLVSPDISAYLEALMAPLATGEELDRAGYLELVSSLYGPGLAEEISQARITAAIEFPGPVQSIRGGKFSGSKAEFDIALLDLLVLETPLDYEVVWRPAR